MLKTSQSSLRAKKKKKGINNMEICENILGKSM